MSKSRPPVCRTGALPLSYSPLQSDLRVFRCGLPHRGLNLALVDEGSNASG